MGTILRTASILLLSLAAPAQAPLGIGKVGSKLRLPTASTPIAPATGAALVDMATQAAIIFAGQVLSIDHQEASGFVDIRFRIEEAVRNCPKNGDYVLREWAGLWTGHDQRYHVGQHLLLLLTARGAAGMSSTVGGPDGAIPLLPTGAQPVADSYGNLPPDEGVTSAATVDLRWIQSRVQRTASPGASAHSTLTDPSPWSGPVAPLDPTSATTTNRPSLGIVLALFGAPLKAAR